MTTTVHVPVGMIRVPINVDSPRWDQSTFRGRLNHFVRIVNPLLTLKSHQDLFNAKTLVGQARSVSVDCSIIIIN